ncbi:MAG: acetate--CoA ligase family protein [Pseudomonadota bacterium]|nr:acetate--CoA ligase family protein [Pseudomonadota bacterium]
MQINGAKQLIARALKRGQNSLSEYDSKRVLSAYGVPVAVERLAPTAQAARDIAEKIGYPVVLKGCSPNLLHKTEAGLIVMGIGSSRELAKAYKDLLVRAGRNYDGTFLVQKMLRGQRELMIGMIRDEQFGPSVMFGLGGIFTEVFRDICFRLAPLKVRDAHQMMNEIHSTSILDAVRGMPKVDRQILSRAIVGVGRAAIDNPEIIEIDINPLIVVGSKPIAVDSLIVLKAQ